MALLTCGFGASSLQDWRRQWHPTPVLLPGKSHGWRSLVGYSPWCCKKLDTAERLDFTSWNLVNVCYSLLINRNVLSVQGGNVNNSLW